IEQISNDDGSGGYQSPCSRAAAFTSALSRPGCTVAVMATGSTVTARMRSVESVMHPSTAVDPPERPVPAPRGTTGTPSRVATSSVRCTSAVQVARTSAAGRPGTTVIARSYRYGSITSGSLTSTSGGSTAASASTTFTTGDARATWAGPW